MFIYEKKLQYPVKIKNCNPKLASFIISQYGGPYFNKLQKGWGVPPAFLSFQVRQSEPCACTQTRQLKRSTFLHAW